MTLKCALFEGSQEGQGKVHKGAGQGPQGGRAGSTREQGRIHEGVGQIHKKGEAGP